MTERVKTVQIKDVVTQIKNDISALSSGFTVDKIRDIDKLYSMFIAFCNFINFDYFFLLKKFDSNVSERNFNYSPKLTPIRAEYILEDLRDFASVAYALPTDGDWVRVFKIIKAVKGVEPVASAQWLKTISRLRDIRKQAVFDQIIKHIAKDPYEKVVVGTVEERVVDDYLQKMRASMDSCVQKIQLDRRSNKIGELTAAIFGSNDVSRLKNYTEKTNEIFKKRMLSGFEYVEPLNYLKAFLLDHFKSDVRNLVDLFLVRGKWTSNALSAPLSQSFYSLMELSDQITAFDENLTDGGDTMSKLRNMVARADRDKGQIKYLNAALQDINDRAESFLVTAAKDFISMGKFLKNLLDDHDRSSNELIINWKELNANSDRDIKEWLTSDYKLIYNFVMLMQFYIKKE